MSLGETHYSEDCQVVQVKETLSNACSSLSRAPVDASSTYLMMECVQTLLLWPWGGDHG